MNKSQLLIIMLALAGFYYMSTFAFSRQMASWSPIESNISESKSVDSLAMQSYSLCTRTTDETGTFHFNYVGELDHVITVYAKGYEKKEVFQSSKSKRENYQIKLKRLKQQ